MEDKIKKIVRETYIEILGSIDINIEKPRNISDDTPIYGSNGYLDSLGLINLVVALEGKIRDTFKTSLTLVNETAMSTVSSPFRDVKALTNYIYSLLKSGINER